MKIINVRYTKEEAQYLIKFYNNKIIGQYLDEHKKYKISVLKMVPLYFEKEYFFVEAHCYPLFSLNVYFGSVGSMAVKLGLPSPAEVLNKPVEIISTFSYRYT